MLQAARKAAPSLLRQARDGLAAAPVRRFASAPQRPTEEEDDDMFELLPPGCSLKDPTYGRSFGANPNRNSMSDPVMAYNSKPVEEYRPVKRAAKEVPQAPRSAAAAQAALQESKDAKKKAKEEAAGAAAAAEEEEPYIYLPPGSSMRDPVSFPNSMSDPLDNKRVYYRDPNPTLRHK